MCRAFVLDPKVVTPYSKLSENLIICRHNCLNIKIAARHIQMPSHLIIYCRPLLTSEKAEDVFGHSCVNKFM